MAGDAPSTPANTSTPRAQSALAGGVATDSEYQEPSLLEQVRAALTEFERRQVLALGALVVVSVALRLLTWDVVADGGQARYIKVTLFAAVASVLVWLLVRIQTSPRSWVPFGCAAFVLLAGDAIHYARVLNPITRGAPLVQVDSPFTSEAAVRSAWDVETSGGGQARFESGSVTLQAPPRGTAFLRAKMGPAPDLAANWWLPLGVGERARVERLAWRATVNRTSPYFVMLDVPSLLIQVVPYGVHVTYPDDRNVMRGHEVQHPVGSDGQPHSWTVVRNGSQVSLSLDGRQVWSAPQRGPLGQMRLGETKVDAEHGGSVRIESASYTIGLER